MTKPASWSFSKLLVFEQCPFRYKLQHLDRIPDLQPKTAADRGTQIHQEGEDYVRGKAPITHNLRYFSSDFTALATHFQQGRVVCEEEWGFGRNWTPAEWKSAWLRLKCDAVVHLTRKHLAVIDYKGLERSTLIPTPTGWSTMGDIQIGDELFSQDGKICQVVGKSKIKKLPCFKITFDDTTTVVCDEEHLWAMSDGEVLNVRNLKRGMRINVCKPVELPEQPLPIHPYVFGLWLADGKHTSSEITKPDDFIWKEVERCGYELGKEQNTNCRTQTVKDIRKHLIELNVLGNKHIPQIYMRGSIAQRLALLQGLMDGDGSVNSARKQVVLQSTNEHLSKQYLELIGSLGQRANRAEVLVKGFGKYTIAYPISFRPIGINPFRLPRKADACANFGAGRNYRQIRSVEEIEPVETQCIAVNSDDHTFLCTERFLPTHNTGKRFGNEIKHARQLQLYALCALIRYPEIEEVTCELWYLDQNELAAFTMKRGQLEKYLKVFDRDGRAVTDTKSFKPRPNIDSCKYCPYHPDRQGDCPHGVTAMAGKVFKAAQPIKIIAPAKPSKFDNIFAQDAERLKGLGND